VDSKSTEASVHSSNANDARDKAAFFREQLAPVFNRVTTCAHTTGSYLLPTMFDRRRATLVTPTSWAKAQPFAYNSHTIASVSISPQLHAVLTA
jgi:hypothetical protein